MRIIYNKPTEVENFDIDRYLKSLNRYGKVKRTEVEKALKDLHYDPMHYSVLVELGVQLLPDDESAKAYWNEHPLDNQNHFERLRRITGYLVGSLERWNDGKQAEERDRVKHGVYSVDSKDELESKKAEVLETEANSCKGKM